MILQSPQGRMEEGEIHYFKKRQMDCPAIPTSSQIGEHDNFSLLHNVWRVIKFNTIQSFIKALSFISQA